MLAIVDITEAIIGEAIAVHRELGPGLVESTYEACLATLLTRRGLRTERQIGMPVIFQGERIECGSGWTCSWNVGLSWS